MAPSAEASRPPKAHTPLETLLYCLSMTLWTGTAVLQPVSLIIAVAFVPNPIAVGYLMLELFLMWLPIPGPDSLPGPLKKLCMWSSKILSEYHDMKIIYEDEESLKAGRAHMIGYEPHSILPLGMPGVFGQHSKVCPKAFRHNLRFLVTSAVFNVPILRHLWTFLGGCPVTRENIEQLLDDGINVVVNPGGVQECLHLEAKQETVYIKTRLGFVRLAMEKGVPLVPVFIFGQTDAYHFYKPGPPLVPKWLVNKMSRFIGFAPILFWGQFGSFLPFPSTMTMVVGKAIDVGDTKGVRPPKEEIQRHLDVYVKQIEDMFEKHKAAAGYADYDLVVM